MNNTIRKIPHLIFQHNTTIRHCYREANNMADILAKWSHEIHEAIIFNNNFPEQAFGHYKLDRIQLPNLTHKVVENIFVAR